MKEYKTKRENSRTSCEDCKGKDKNFKRKKPKLYICSNREKETSIDLTNI